MQNFKLGTKPKDLKVSTKEIYYPTITIEEKLPKGFEVGQNFSGKLVGKITGFRNDNTGNSFQLEAHTIAISPTKISDEEFEKMPDEEKEKFQEESIIGKGPRTDTERLKAHFGTDWKKHKVSDLPPRGSGRR